MSNYYLYFALLIALALGLSVPATYCLFTLWLTDFAYQTSISFTPFLFSAIIIFGVALLTVTYQTVKAALGKPINALQSE